MDQYVKFCIIRNPYDRIISAYHFMGGNLTFKDFCHLCFIERLTNIIAGIKIHLLFFYHSMNLLSTKQETSQMDEIIYFEKLKEQFPAFCQKYNLDIGELPHINARKRKKKAIKEYYDQETADMIYKLYKRDFKAFGYHRLVFKRREKN